MKTGRMGTTETPPKEPSILLYILLSKVQKVSSGSERQGADRNKEQPHSLMLLTKTISESFCNPVVEERVEAACISEGNYFKMTKGTCIIVTFSEHLFPVAHIMFLPEALLWCYSGIYPELKF